ncbi:MAG TPA: hypothetical protein VH300_05070 [Thermoleophilaceae bacterium]|jgi:hypothetical protein|nr:hypothetical protein [Thermoleophilaceae bacterium]
MPPDQRPIPRFIAEPPHDALPYGRWADQLRGLFLEAIAEIETDGEELGRPDDINWFPERTLAGRTYIPATARTSEGLEIFGFVAFDHGPGGEPSSFTARADYTDETAEANPEWQLDLSDEEIGTWRGSGDLAANVALVWGHALKPGGALATAELGPTTTDQCEVVEDRFTLVSLDGWTGDLLEVRLWDGKGGLIASESLYEDDE